MRKWVVAALALTLVLLGMLALYRQQRAAPDTRDVSTPAAAQDADCETPAPPQQKPSAPPEFALTESCGEDEGRRMKDEGRRLKDEG